MLEFIDVWKSAGNGAGAVKTLAGASVVIPPGRKVGLFGADPAANGVILRMMSGLEQPQKGVLRRSGTPCWPFDHNFMDGGATVAQNAIFLSRVYGFDHEDVLHITSALSGVRLVKGKPFSHYQLTERRHLQLGMLSAFQFDWYFVNEKVPHLPNNNPALEIALADRLERSSVIWATINPKRISAYCDAALVLDRGLLTFYNHFDEAAEVFNRALKRGNGKLNARKRRDQSEHEHPAGGESPLDS